MNLLYRICIVRIDKIKKDILDVTIYKLDPLKPNCFYNPVREIIVLYKENLALFQANIIQKYKEDL